MTARSVPVFSDCLSGTSTGYEHETSFCVAKFSELLALDFAVGYDGTSAFLSSHEVTVLSRL